MDTVSHTKSSSKKLTNALKLVESQHTRYCDRLNTYTDVKRKWIVYNSTDIHDHINNVNKRKRAKNVSTFDFSTLYTKINHEELMAAMSYVVDKAFLGSRAERISIYDTGSRWSNSPSESTFSVDCEELKDMIRYLVSNIYFTFGDTVFRQTIGIPMGTDCAPFLANLFLYSYEFKYMEKLCKENYSLARKLSLTFRYIDDLITLNSDEDFDRNRTDIYPASLKLNKENTTNSTATFLDLEINVENRMFITKLYDKRDAFNFEIVNFPNLSGNIPSKTSYGVFISQLIRYSVACMNYTDFITRCKSLVDKLEKQHFSYGELQKTFKKFARKYHELLAKYEKSKDIIMEDIF